MIWKHLSWARSDSCREPRRNGEWWRNLYVRIFSRNSSMLPLCHGWVSPQESDVKFKCETVRPTVSVTNGTCSSSCLNVITARVSELSKNRSQPTHRSWTQFHAHEHRYTRTHGRTFSHEFHFTFGRHAREVASRGGSHWSSLLVAGGAQIAPKSWLRSTACARERVGDSVSPIACSARFLLPRVDRRLRRRCVLHTSHLAICLIVRVTMCLHRCSYSFTCQLSRARHRDQTRICPINWLGTHGIFPTTVSWSTWTNRVLWAIPFRITKITSVSRKCSARLFGYVGRQWISVNWLVISRYVWVAWDRWCFWCNVLLEYSIFPCHNIDIDVYM